MKSIDIVVAVRNEELTLKSFISDIRNISVPGFKLRMIFIEDGSSDKTVDLLKEISHSSDDVDFYSIINPYGQGLALTYGILKSKADAVISMDVDGSHPVEIISRMIGIFTKGYHIVQGNRIAYDRKYLYRKISSKLYFYLFSLFTGVNLYKQNVHFRLMSRKAIDVFSESPKTWFSLRLKNNSKNHLLITYIYFIAPERNFGQSKFNLIRLLKFAYISFLTLTDVSVFSLMNFCLIGLLVIIYLYISPFLMILFALLGILNIYYYIRINNIKYLNRMTIKEFKNNLC